MLEIVIASIIILISDSASLIIKININQKQWKNMLKWAQ